MINGLGTPLASVELTKTQLSITLDNIPQNYSELFIVLNIKSLGSSGFAGGGATDWDELNINNTYSNSYARQTMYAAANGSFQATRNFNVPIMYGEQFAGNNNAFQNEFSTHLWWIPNYTNTSQWKNVYHIGGRTSDDPNGTGGAMGFAVTHLYKSTSAINRLDIGSTYGYLPGSTVELFGTKRLGL